MPGAQAGTSEAVELQMSPFVPFDDRRDERRKACGRVGDPDFDTLLVFDTKAVLGSATVRKNVSG
eukprot:6865900-Alexandrium_andersonii.AAC.1